MTITMYDAITVAALPRGAQAYAGYVGGQWPTYSSLPPAPYKLSVAINASEDAECLDIESGDAVTGDAPGWCKRQLARGVIRPCLYTSASNVSNLISTMSGAGIPRSAYRIWSAHYTYTAHICAPGTCDYPAADGTQWTDQVNGGAVDQSLLVSDFFNVPVPPVPLEQDMAVALPPAVKTATGALQSTPVCVSFDGAPYTSIGFLADVGLVGASVTEIRIAQHYVSGGWKVDTYAITSASPKAVFLLDANVDSVSLLRLDDVNLTLYPNFA